MHIAQPHEPMEITLHGLQALQRSPEPDLTARQTAVAGLTKVPYVRIASTPGVRLKAGQTDIVPC